MIKLINKSSGKVTKRKRINKNRKKNWRKHIDISDVEKALEGERLEIRTTGGLISEKTDDELFYFDKCPEDEISKGKKFREKRSRVDTVIVPDPEAVRLPTSLSKRSKRFQERRLDKKAKNLPKPTRRPRKAKAFDLWTNDSKELYDKEMKKKDVDKHTEVVVGNASYRRPQYLQAKPGDVQGYKFRNTPAVEVAHPGASYNPTYDDHQDLLEKAHMAEEKKVKAEEKIKRALHVPYEDLPDADTHAREMEEGLFTVESDKEEETADAEEIVQNPPVQAIDRKTRRTRNRELHEKLSKEKKEKEWRNRLRENEVYRVKTFLSEIKAKERRDAATRLLRSKKTRLLTLSNVKFEEPDLELKLSDELRGSLRELKPECGVLADRYKSFQKRGIIEPRCKRNKPKSKKKTKYQEKRAWREITL